MGINAMSPRTIADAVGTGALTGRMVGGRMTGAGAEGLETGFIVGGRMTGADVGGRLAGVGAGLGTVLDGTGAT